MIGFASLGFGLFPKNMLFDFAFWFVVCGLLFLIPNNFAKIIVEGTTKHPYYGILFFNPTDGEYHVGFGSYYIGNVFQWLSEEFEIVDKDTNALTNADRIRAMSDEELADFITDKEKGWCTDIGREMYYQHNLEWLEQPAEVSKDGK
jgi:hypothetical protein